MSRRKREERLRKVLQTRERAEQIEEERKRRIEQKIALSEEKTEKVRPDALEVVGLCLQPWTGRFPRHPRGEHRLHAAARGTRKCIGDVGCGTAPAALGSSSNGSSSTSSTYQWRDVPQAVLVAVSLCSPLGVRTGQMGQSVVSESCWLLLGSPVRESVYGWDQ